MVFARHCLTAIPELVADRLPQDRREHVGNHIRACPRCRRAYTVELWTRRFAREHFNGAMPPDLESRIRDAIEFEDRRTRPRGLAPGAPVRRVLTGGLAAAAAFALWWAVWTLT